MYNSFLRKCVRFLVSNRLKAVTAEECLREIGGKVFIGNRKLDAEEVAMLKIEAESFEKTLLWRLMSNNIYWIANLKMQKGAEREQEMDFGRAMVYNLDILEQFIKKISQLR